MLKDVSGRAKPQLFCRLTGDDKFAMAELIARTWQSEKSRAIEWSKIPGVVIENGAIEIPYTSTKTLLLHVATPTVMISDHALDIPPAIMTSLKRELGKIMLKGTVKPGEAVKLPHQVKEIPPEGQTFERQHLYLAKEFGGNVEAKAKKRTAAKEPTLMEKAKSLTDAVASWTKAGFKMATEEQYAARYEICKACDFWVDEGYMGMGKCRQCGCSGVKLRLATSTCPLEKWGKV
jgi:hypothetical protein